MTDPAGEPVDATTRDRVWVAAQGVAGVILLGAAVYCAFWRPRDFAWVVSAIVLVFAGLILLSSVYESGRRRLETRVGKRAIAIAGGGIVLMSTLMGLVSPHSSPPPKPSNRFAAVVMPGAASTPLRQFLRAHDGARVFLDLRFSRLRFLPENDPRLVKQPRRFGSVTQDATSVGVVVPSPCESHCHPGDPSIPSDQLVLSFDKSPDLVFTDTGDYQVRGWFSELYAGSHTATDGYELRPVHS